MLEQLHIRNLATIEAADIDFGAGFSVLSGETGAGKSILIDALGLVLGTRADAGLIRGGCDKAEISARFRLSDAADAREWLSARELADVEDADACLIRRVLLAEGRTRAFVNGSPIPAGALRELGEKLIEVFGQNESQTLRSADTQRRLLDDDAESEALAAVLASAQRWQQGEARIAELRAQAARDPAQLEFLRFQVGELEALAPEAGELERLDTDHKRLANAGRLIEDGNGALERLYSGEDSAHDRLGQIAHVLTGLAPLHAGFGAAEELVTQAQTQVREAGNQLSRLLDRLELDPAGLAEIERRLAVIHDLARKHRLRAEDLPARLEALRAELSAAETSGEQLAELRQAQEKELRAYRECAQRLSQQRRNIAARLAAEVTKRVRELGMAHARFEIAVESSNQERPRPQGIDEVRFDFSANPGQAPRALAKVASGGELSRVSLALQVSLRGRGGAPTLIFDEVDAGIGGGVADIVGRQLRGLGEQCQVLCVTHLGQVAAHGRRHFAVTKDVRAGQTYTRIEALDPAGRRSEIARMIGGDATSAATITVARELLREAERGSQVE